MDDIRTQLMAVPGIAEADLDADNGDAPSGVRIRLAPDADADTVGAAVQRILAEHGMRSRFAGDEGSAGETEPDPAPEPAAAETTVRSSGAPEPAVSEIETEPSPEPDASVPAELESVSVTETPRGVSITATTAAGRTVTREAGSGAAEILTAAANTAAVLAESPPAEVLSAESSAPSGILVVTAVLRRSDGELVAGAAVAVASAAHAAARAAWDALVHPPSS